MKILELACSSLKLDANNARLHSEENIAAIKRSLAAFGQQKPIVINDDNTVLAGNGTLVAALQLGWETLKCVRSSLVGPEATAYAIADNRTGEFAYWDEAELTRAYSAMASDLWDATSLQSREPDLTYQPLQVDAAAPAPSPAKILQIVLIYEQDQYTAVVADLEKICAARGYSDHAFAALALARAAV